MINMIFALNIMFCDIKGEVKNPGVYKVDNNNIQDVINMAGGITKNADTSVLNLSKKVHDEMVIYIPNKNEKPKICPVCSCQNEIIYKTCEKKEISKEESTTSIPTTTTKPVTTTILTTTVSPTSIITTTRSGVTSTTTTEAKPVIININKASLDELQTLSGIGEVIAIRIIEYRESQPFENIEEIMNVKGIGETLFAKIKDFITV